MTPTMILARSTSMQHNWYLATVPRKMLTPATSESATGSKLARSAVADTSLPDLAIGIVHPTRVVSGNAYEWCDIYVEFKNDKSKLAEGCGQVLDRAKKRRIGAWAKKKVVLGNVSIGTDLLLMIVFTNAIASFVNVTIGNKSVPVSHIVKGACRVMEPQLFRWKSCPIVLMSYIGELLHGKTLPIRDATEMGASLLETVLKLHKLGIIHRDISPRKVAYHEGKEGVGLERFYLLDFRIAVFVSDNCVSVTGMDLPWSAAAQEEDGDLVVTIRCQVLDKGFLAEFEEPSFNQLQQVVFNVHPDVPSPHMLPFSNFYVVMNHFYG
ncbi:hypothetical protein SELMODRAFT_428836 [Selaginella moellendorffii]|uniref:Protein kinase domain-containing protein n=1 Tax=Selaginella moellendorffii TaxID=88036 RepID=D8T460_SELML|nr:hypothetical protein SELMODRAFT_428836 [Selaginella moellendorffii]